MADAVQPYETRIAEILRAAAEPMTAAGILQKLGDSYGMKGLRRSEVNTVLYSSTPAAYQKVPSSQPPAWYLAGHGTAAEAVALARQIESLGRGKTEEAPNLYHSLEDLPSWSDEREKSVPPDAFANAPVVVGGDSNDATTIGETIGELVARGAESFVCLIGQPSGELAYATVGRDDTPTATTIPYPGDAPRRSILTKAHREAVAAKPACLCLFLAGPASSSYEIHHLLACAEAANIRVFRVCGRPGNEG